MTSNSAKVINLEWCEVFDSIIELITGVILHVNHLYLYLNSGGQRDDRDFHSFGARSMPMRRSPDRRWHHRSDVPGNDHRASSFERYARPNSPWQSRPRSPPPYPREPPPRSRSPVRPKPLTSLLSLGRLQDPFDDNRHPRSTFADARPSSQSFYPSDRSWQTATAAARSATAAEDVVPKHMKPTQSMDTRHQSYQPPPKQKTYQHYEMAPHGSGAGASDTKQHGTFSKFPRDEQHRVGKWSGKQPAASRKKKAKSAKGKGHLSRKMHSVSNKAVGTGQPAKDADPTPANTAASSESTVAIRPEDIIIIRRYNIDGSTPEEKPEEGGQNAKRHVVRLVRNNVLSPITSSRSRVDDKTKKDDAESDNDSRQQSVVKRRNWSGTVTTARPAVMGEGTGHQASYSGRLVDIDIRLLQRNAL